MKRKSPEIQLLLDIIDQAYDHMAWHGTNLRGSIRGLDAEQAAWRPAPDRHNIWEVVVHAAYWKYIVRRRLLHEKRGSFSLKGSNWFARPADSPHPAWQEDIALLEATHRSLREAVASFPAKKLTAKPPNSKMSNIRMIYGIASHDLYHAGQIQLLKRFLPSRE
jgi:hypothetical protein